MVQGLGFLSKKSWHTKNLANQEKVWMAEQRKEAETQKTKELAKQIQQEREEEEMEKISGKKGTKLDRGIDWMYQGSTGELAKEDSERKAEEFLLGKEFVGDGATQGDFDNGDQDQGIHTVLKHQEDQHAADQAAAAAASNSAYYANEPSVKDRNEDFRLRVEDPMFMVSQKQREKEVRHDKTKALYERVVGYHEDDKSGKQTEKGEDRVLKKKASKKEKKRQKKHKKTKSSKRDRDQADESGESYSEDDTRLRHQRRGRSRSPSLDRHRSKRPKRSPSYDRHRFRSDDSDEESRSGRRDRHRNHRDEDRCSGRSRHHHREREEGSSSRGRRGSRRDHSDSEDNYKKSRRNQRHDNNDDHRKRQYHERDHKRRHDDNFGEHHDRRHSKDDDREQRRPESNHLHSKPAAAESSSHVPKKEGYGLKGASITVDRGNLGPSRDLLQKRRDEQEAERRKIRETASSRRQRTEAERAKDLEEMQANARKREESRSRGHNSNKYDDDGGSFPRKGDASFLKDITRQTHGIGDGGQTLSSRVAQNRHTNQRLHDSFL